MKAAASTAEVQEQQLSPKQQQLIISLMMGNDIRTACKMVGIAEITYYRWVKLPHFATALKNAKNHIYNEALDELKALMPMALAALKKHITAKSKPTASTQARAAIEVLVRSIEISKLDEIQNQIAELYQLLDRR